MVPVASSDVAPVVPHLSSSISFPSSLRVIPSSHLYCFLSVLSLSPSLRAATFTRPLLWTATLCWSLGSSWCQGKGSNSKKMLKLQLRRNVMCSALCFHWRQSSSIVMKILSNGLKIELWLLNVTSLLSPPENARSAAKCVFLLVNLAFPRPNQVFLQLNTTGGKSWSGSCKSWKASQLQTKGPKFRFQHLKFKTN